MSSLYKRASARQQKILRIVEGAVKNTADHHPEFEFSPRLARSIAKRAAGTLTAAWPDVLAAPVRAPPDKPCQDRYAIQAGPSGSQFVTVLKNEQGNKVSLPAPRGGVTTLHGPTPPLRKTIRDLSLKVAVFKGQGRLLEAEGMIEALRIISHHLGD